MNRMKKFLLVQMAVAVWLTGQLRAAPAEDPLDCWHQLNPDAELYDLVDAHFQNGRWVAMTGYPGSILNSLDGTNWTKANFNAPAGFRMRSLHFGGGRWLAIAGDHSVATSEDGVVWSTLPDLRFPVISYGNGRWVAFAGPSQDHPPQLFWSTDGLAWKLATSTFDLGGLVFGGGQWLAMGLSELSSSSDGEHWIARALPEEMKGTLVSLNYGNGIWLILASPCTPDGCSNVFWKSLDGVRWEKLVHDGGNIGVGSFVHQPDGGLWFGGSDGKICTSTNLSQWKCAATAFTGGDIVWVGGRWVRSSTWINYEVFVSTNGLDWSSATAAVPTRAVAYGQGKWLGLNNHNQLLSSTNGNQWTVAKSFLAGESLTDLAFGDGLWVFGGTVQGTNLIILNSADGQTWTPATIVGNGPRSGYLQNVRHTREGWRAMIQSGSPMPVFWLLSSQDGRNWIWSPLGNNPVDSASEVISGNLRARIEVGWHQELIYQSSITTSTDGVNWTFRYGGHGLSDVTLANGRLMAMSLNGSLLESDPLLSLSQSGAGALIVRRAAGIPIVLESTADLSRWQTLTNLPFGKPIQNFTDLGAASSPTRFYRVRTP